MPVVNVVSQAAHPKPIHCEVCGKNIPKFTISMDVPTGEIPKVYQDQSGRSCWNGQPILQILRRKPCCRIKGDSISVWLGEFWSKGGNFCSLLCCERFARAAYKAGYRMKK